MDFGRTGLYKEHPCVVSTGRFGNLKRKSESLYYYLWPQCADLFTSPTPTHPPIRTIIFLDANLKMRKNRYFLKIPTAFSSTTRSSSPVLYRCVYSWLYLTLRRTKKISLEICLDWTGWKLGIGHSPLHPTPPHPHEAPPTQHSLCAPEDLSLAICPRIVLRAVCRAGPRRSCGYS